MTELSRRYFLGSTLTGLAAASTMPSLSRLLAADKATEPPETLFLTWQRDPTTTMTVQWVGPHTGDDTVSVQYAVKGSNDWKTEPATSERYPLCDEYRFRSELTGLTPGTRYEFRVGSSRPLQFETMPAKATDTIHFISGGDCGTSEHAVDNTIQAARQDPMFAVIGGDIAYDNGRSVKTNLTFLKNYGRLMVSSDGRMIPLVPCIGNHEADGAYGQPRKNAPFFYSLFDGLFPETGYATLDFGDYLSLVLLDTGHTSEIGGDQADWLDKTLKARRDHPHTIIINHVPAYPSYRPAFKENGEPGAGAGNREHWVPLFDRYRVPLVLEHHDHTFKRSKPLLNGLEDSNGVLYLGDGSWGKLRAARDPEDMPYMARVASDYHLTLHRIEGDERFHMAISDEGRIMDVCRTGQRVTGAVSYSVPGRP